MTNAESRTISYAIAGSLAVHVLLGLGFAIWTGVFSMHAVAQLVTPAPDPEPDVVLVFPEPPNLEVTPPPPPEPPKPLQPFIRTSQNTEAEKPPEQSSFESDRNTMAMSKAPAVPGGNPAMPSMTGDSPFTSELANRNYKAGDTKDDAAPPPPPTPPTPATPPKVAEAAKPEPPMPAAPPPPPPAEAEAPAPPPPAVAKKEESPAEKQMRELDQALVPTVPPKPEPPKPEPAPTPSPVMRDPDELPVPKAIPMAKPVEPLPKPQEGAFQPETRVGTIKGGISTPGTEDAVAAAATPVGRYQRRVTSAIEKRWNQLVNDRRDAMEPGFLSLRFYVTKDGSIADLEFIQKNASPLLEDVTLDAILKAEIPPLPPDLVPMLNRGRLEMTYNVVITPSR